MHIKISFNARGEVSYILDNSSHAHEIVVVRVKDPVASAFHPLRNLHCLRQLVVMVRRIDSRKYLFPCTSKKCAQIILAKHPSFGVSSLIILLKEVQELCLSSAALKIVISYIIYIYNLNARLQEREPFVQEG